MKRALLLTLFLATALQHAGPATASGPPAEGPATQPTVKVQSLNLTAFPRVEGLLLVEAADGRPVHGLGRRDFEVREDGQTSPGLQIHPVSPESDTLAVILAIDISGSMQGEPLDAARKAAAGFVRSLGPTDLCGLVTFDTKVTVVSRPTRDHRELQRKIAGIRAGTDTAALDAVRASLALVHPSSHRRKGILLLTDGRENSSRTPVGVIDAELRAADVPLYCVGLGDDLDEKMLRHLAGVTGGRYLRAPRPADLAALFERVARELNSQYRLEGDSRLREDQEPHTLEIRVVTPMLKAGWSGEFLATRGTGYHRQPQADRSLLRRQEGIASLALLWGLGAALLAGATTLLPRSRWTRGSPGRLLGYVAGVGIIGLVVGLCLGLALQHHESLLSQFDLFLNPEAP